MGLQLYTTVRGLNWPSTHAMRFFREQPLGSTPILRPPDEPVQNLIARAHVVVIAAVTLSLLHEIAVTVKANPCIVGRQWSPTPPTMRPRLGRIDAADRRLVHGFFAITNQTTARRRANLRVMTGYALRPRSSGWRCR